MDLDIVKEKHRKKAIEAIQDRITCTTGCSKVFDLICNSLDGKITTPRGRIEVSQNGAMIFKNGDFSCLRITATLEGKKDKRVLPAHALA